MPQGFASVLSTPEPLKPLGGVQTTTVQVFAPLIITWTDASTDIIPAGFLVTSLETGASLVDASLNVWLLVAVKGTTTLRLATEADFANLDTLTSAATWAVLYRMQLARIDVEQQA